MYVIIWEYQVKPDRLAEFEENYSANGAWAQLFRKNRGFLETELLADKYHPHRYVTIDRWASAQDYEAFFSAWKDAYADLDARFEDLTERETLLGRWESIVQEID